MIYLADSNVLSEVAKKDPHPAVDGWFQNFEPHIVTSDLVLGEIYYGIHLLPDGPRRDIMEAWFRRLLEHFSKSIRPFDTKVALAHARYRAAWRKAGIIPPTIDGMIAATARFHGLTVATRNVADFEKTGCEVVNPFES
ncbi:MAG: putative nucleic acid-binding protein [Akkermansiaceae bacterium]|jgi:predicted nucleic acid-binding protein